MEVFVRVPLAGGSKVYPLTCDEDFQIWHLKIKVFDLCCSVLPSKQSLYLHSNETKELDVNINHQYISKHKTNSTNNNKEYHKN